MHWSSSERQSTSRGFKNVEPAHISPEHISTQPLTIVVIQIPHLKGIALTDDLFLVKLGIYALEF